MLLKSILTYIKKNYTYLLIQMLLSAPVGNLLHLSLFCLTRGYTVSREKYLFVAIYSQNSAHRY